MSNRQIAQRMGRSPGAVDKYLHLLEMPDDFQLAVAQKRVSMQVALTLNEIDDPEFRKFYFTSAVENGITVDVALAWLNDWRKTRSGTAYAELGGGAGALGVQEVMPIFQTCAACLGPVDVTKVRYIPVCPSCEPRIKGALKEEKS